MAADGGVVLIGVAADSGCGKSTFMRRLTGIFGGTNVGPLGGGFDNGGWETNTLVSDTTTVICLDDYHLNDRGGRKVTGRTALDLAENNFDLMYEQLKELKSGNAIKKTHLQSCEWDFGYARGDHPHPDRHRGRFAPDGRSSRQRTVRFLALLRHHGRRQVRLEDSKRYGGKRPLAGVDPAVHRS